MRRTYLLTATLLATLAAPAGAVTLVGRAVLPADTFAPGPTSGQFITGANGISVPFVNAQPVQGFSGVIPGPLPGTFDFILDNGFGAKSNSADSLLRVFSLRPDFGTGTVTPVDYKTGAPTTFNATNYYITLADPNGLSGFRTIANQATYPNGTGTIPVAPAIQSGKLLTGSDYDIEGIARARNGTYYFGEEFGPFVIHTDANGNLLSTPVLAPNVSGVGSNPYIQSADYPTPIAGSALPAKGTANAQVSGGFEGFTISPDKSKIYTLLEKSLLGDPNQQSRIINVFDTATDTFETKALKYRVGDPSGANNGINPTANSIGDMVMINDHQILVLERDQNQGAASRFKRVYLIDLNQLDADGFVSKTLVADLLNIADPRGLGGNGTTNGIFTFPFITIEDIIPIDANTILIANDNNYPFSSGRTPGVVDNNEIALIRLDQSLTLDPSLVLSVTVPEPASLGLLAIGTLLATRRRLRSAPARRVG